MPKATCLFYLFYLLLAPLFSFAQSDNTLYRFPDFYGFPHRITLERVVRETHPMRLGSFTHHIRVSKKKIFSLDYAQPQTGQQILHAGQDSFLVNYAAAQYFSIVKINNSATDSAQYRLSFELPMLPNEVFWGGGEQYSHFALNGSTLPIWAEEQGIGRGDMPISALTQLQHASGTATSSLAPLARFRSSAGRGFSLDLSGYSTISFKKNTIRVQTMLAKSLVSLTPMARNNGADNGADIGANTGANTGGRRNNFMLGTVVGLQGGTDSVLQKLSILERQGVKPSAIWLQDWCGRRITPFGKQLNWAWTLDTVRYPRFAAFRQILAQKNIKLLGYINPFLAADLPLAKVAVQQKLVLTHRDGTPYKVRATGFEVYLLDVAQPAAIAWLTHQVAQELVANGFVGWMADFGEWCPADAYTTAQAQPQLQPHSEYARAWAALNAHIIKQLSHDSLTFFMRSAAIDSPEYTPFYWAGDQNTTWQRNDGLPSAVTAMLSSGMSGMLVNHSDVGGFTSFRKGIFGMTRSRELLYRWIELGAFSPVFRTHEGLAPDYNKQVYSDAACAKFYARFARLRDSLQPYLIKTYEETFTKGLPMARPLCLQYPTDSNTYSLQYQYLLGETLLVIPVLRKNATAVKGYFPKGKWRHLLRNETIESNGEWRTVSAPLGTPAVFGRVADSP